MSIVGTNFGSSGAVVTVGTGPSALRCAVVPATGNHSHIDCIMAGGLGFNMPVTVTIGGQSSNTSQRFSFDG